MDRVFRSKVGWWYHLIIVLVALGSVAAFLQAGIWPIAIMVLIAVLTVHVFLNTWYRITADGMLIAHCSIFPEKKIAISDIQALEPTMMPDSSYALSLDRILIWSEGKPWLMVSPKEKVEFVALLKKINPDIVLKKEHRFI
ncbi:MAG: PH domain-containing protein [Tannerellaceae bacterium]|jgi:hypothetical protein|nr:PH domain-containing protein [Tannerellaceae bacterium]